MIPVISIVGRKNSGKTRLIEGLVPELKKRGWRIGTIKHDVHSLKNEDVDRKDTDTYRHQLAGADVVVLSGPNKLMLIKNVTSPYSIDDIRRRYLGDLDLILTEGYKSDNKPKIEVFRQEIAGENGLLCTQERDNLVAVVSDCKIDIDLPYFDLTDYSKIADFLEKGFILQQEKPTINLVVDHKRIPLKKFVAEFLKKTIVGMISSLKGVPENPQEIEIIVHRDKTMPCLNKG